jgi:hypothetical protein
MKKLLSFLRKVYFCISLTMLLFPIYTELRMIYDRLGEGKSAVVSIGILLIAFIALIPEVEGKCGTPGRKSDRRRE